MVFLNRAAEKIFGATLRPGGPCPICGQLTGLPLSVDGTVRPGALSGAGRESGSRPHSAQGGVGQPHPLTVTATPIQGQGDEPAGCLVVLREHEELLAHPVVQLQIATLSSILENFPIPFFMVDPDLVVTHVNERLERLTGYPARKWWAG